MVVGSWLFERVMSGLSNRGPWSRDGIDTMLSWVADLPRLTGAELRAAEDAAIALLRTGDTRAAEALGTAGCQRARPDLLAIATGRTNSPDNRLRAASGLLKLGGERGRAIILEILNDAEVWIHDRELAARLLGENPDLVGVAELWRLARDRDHPLAFSGLSALLEVHGVARFRSDRRDRLTVLGGLMLSPLAALRAIGEERLRDIFDRADAGATPDELGLRWRATDAGPVAAFRDSLDSDTGPYTVDGLDELTGWARVWLEETLLWSLSWDRRAAPVLAGLGMRRAIAPLRELDPTDADVTAALKTLTAP